VTEFHMNRVWSRTGAPFVGVIIAPMQHGETWTGGYAGSVVGNWEVDFRFARYTFFRGRTPWEHANEM